MSSDTAKCSRDAKHNTSAGGGGGETAASDGGVPSKDDNVSLNGSISSRRGGSRDEGGVPPRADSASINGDDYSSVSGSRRSLRSITEGETNGNFSGGGDGDSLRTSQHNDDGDDRSSVVSQRQQRPKTSVKGRVGSARSGGSGGGRPGSAGSRPGSAGGRPGSAGSRSITSRRSYDDDFEIASFPPDDNTNTDFSQYIDVVRQESSRLSQHEDMNPAPLDMSLLHSVLGDLSLSLKDSEARSLRIYGDIEEVREATMELKKIIVGRLLVESDAEPDADGKQNGE